MGSTSVSSFGNGRVQTQTNCSQCGKETTVPFRPSQGRPVLCRECFMGKRRTQASA
jgi:CxxC-x17-CxxC domain-containing protein